MDGFASQYALYACAVSLIGIGLGWLLRGRFVQRSLGEVSDELQLKLDDVIRERDRSIVETDRLRASVAEQQAVVTRHENAASSARTQLESAQEKINLLSKDLFTLRAERENFKNNVSTIQNALNSVKQQTIDLQTEFVKSREFYKGELAKSFEKRKVLEAKINDAQLEHESYSNLLQASRSEHDSANKILASAQTRLGNLDSLEQNVIALEAENAQLNHDAAKSKQRIEALQWDVAELEELKVQNKELAHCLESMENSRKQYEDDAQRYRNHAGKSEQRSETLRVKLDEVEKNFADIEKQQRDAISSARRDAVVRDSGNRAERKNEVDDLQEIVGIGKVFEQSLHELGIYNFRQIAGFDVSDIARVNVKLKEFKGRMEQDDWVGQAKELHFKKYGGIAARD